jgi:hypothetical protein
MLDPVAAVVLSISTRFPVTKLWFVVVVNVATFVAVGIERAEIEIGVGVAGTLPAVTKYSFEGSPPST